MKVRSVVGHEGEYEVTDQGEVRSVDRTDRGGKQRKGKVLSPRVTDSGHLTVRLYTAPGVGKHRFVHALVLEAFDGPCPPGLEARHLNNTPSDNRRTNLEWATRSVNQRDRLANGTHNQANKTHCPSGHEYDEENTYRRPGGGRDCRLCIKNPKLRAGYGTRRRRLSSK